MSVHTDITSAGITPADIPASTVPVATTPAVAASPPTRPSWSADPWVLDDLEMLVLGAYAPLRGFLGPADIASVRCDGRLVDGTPWPVPITLTVGTALGEAAATAGALDLLDEEGTPVATVVVREAWPVSHGLGLAGEVIARRPVERGTHRPLRRCASDARGDGSPTVGLPLRRPLRPAEVAALIAAAGELDARVRLLPMTGCGSPDGVDAGALVRGCLRVRDELIGGGIDADVVPVAVPRHEGASDERLDLLAARVAQAYGASIVSGPLDGAEQAPVALTLSAVPEEPATEPRSGGLAVLFSGLSGSGKSTLANAVRDSLAEVDERPVTLLDGDLVRRMLSAELTFSREHRELNVRRIAFVAAEVARHGGTVLCAPIAPYAAGRSEFREMVEQAGGRFVLVHVATPLEVCEARDRKGLYAKARRGEIPHFTGVSDPYQRPLDADLVIDTSRTALDASVAAVLAVLRRNV